jgi:hypothetical protein
MDVTALVPGLKIKVQGTLNGEGQIEAKKVSLHPDSFDITVAQEQQILANKAAAEHAQTTADQGVANASGQFIERLATERPDLFAHWRLGMTGTFV